MITVSYSSHYIAIFPYCCLFASCFFPNSLFLQSSVQYKKKIVTQQAVVFSEFQLVRFGTSLKYIPNLTLIIIVIN
jgi:hypothetical protein